MFTEEKNNLKGHSTKTAKKKVLRQTKQLAPNKVLHLSLEHINPSKNFEEDPHYHWSRNNFSQNLVYREKKLQTPPLKHSFFPLRFFQSRSAQNFYVQKKNKTKAFSKIIVLPGAIPKITIN
jgi:hypothetical protein